MAWGLDKSPSQSLFIVLTILIIGLSIKALFFETITSPSVRDFVGKETVMIGTIAGEIIQRDSAQEVTLKNITVGDEIQNGKILARLAKFQKFSTGDILEFRCEMVVPEPFNGFDYAAYLESRGIYAVCYQPESFAVQGKVAWNISDALLSLRLAMIDRLGKIFPEPHAAFMSGILFGGSQGLSQDMKGDFSKTGLSHVMAASGYNVSIFSQLLLVLLMRSTLGRRRAIIASGLLVILYIFLAGATPPVIRAGIMGVTVMLGTWLGRTPHAGNLLLLSAFLMM
ncbi:MAG: ComEC/Rec2 family competence protein, partial [Syntrophales bacterium]